MNPIPHRMAHARLPLIARTRLPSRLPSLLTALALAAGLTPAQAQDQATLEATSIVGNRELPKVLYIVPWKKPLPVPLSGRPDLSVLDEPLAPVDREVFRRYLALDGAARARAAAATAPTPPSLTPSPTPAPLPGLPGSSSSENK